MYVSFETNIRISNFVFEYPNIRIFSEYSNIRLSPSNNALHGTINANIMCLTFSTVLSGEVFHTTLDNEYRML